MERAAAKHLAKIDASNTGPICPQTPTPKQQEFLDATELEVLYGGAAAGGKSSAVLMDAARFVHIPNYRALIMRRTYAQLAATGGLIERSKEWWLGKATWSEKYTRWTFPSGAVIGFKHMQREDDKHDIQSIEIHRAYLEECNQFTESQARYVISRIRKNQGDPIPLALRMTTNPGGHPWVKRFVMACRDDPEGEAAKGRRFIGARLEDNPHVNQEEYRAGLERLDPITKAMLLHGDWDAEIEGGYFQHEAFNVVDALPAGAKHGGRFLRAWDLAATNPKQGTDPDYTVGVLMCIFKDHVFVVDVVRVQKDPAAVDEIMLSTARNDGARVSIREELQPAAAGKAVEAYHKRAFMGYDWRAVPATGSKTDRARPWSAAVANGQVSLVRGAWVPEFIAEHCAFPHGGHDDQVDASALAFVSLASGAMTGQAETVQRSRGTRGIRGAF